jgi:hypothetical protein
MTTDLVQAKTDGRGVPLRGLEARLPPANADVDGKHGHAVAPRVLHQG